MKQLEEHPYFAAGLLGIFSLPFHLVLPENISQAGAATILAMIAGIYIGFAVMDGRAKTLVVEGSVAILFSVFAAVALVLEPLLIPVGYILHGFWDAVHHRSHVDTAMPHWYIPLCALYDIIAGFALWLIWWLV